MIGSGFVSSLVVVELVVDDVKGKDEIGSAAGSSALEGFGTAAISTRVGLLAGSLRTAFAVVGLYFGPLRF